jgi:hypothetical protein
VVFGEAPVAVGEELAQHGVGNGKSYQPPQLSPSDAADGAVIAQAVLRFGSVVSGKDDS